MKQLANAIAKHAADVFDPFKENGSRFYVSASVDETDEARECAKEEHPFVLGMNDAFGCLKVYAAFDDAKRAALQFLRRWRYWAIANGYKPEGEICEDWEGEYNDWAYADFTHDGKPVRIRVEIQTLSY